MCHSERWLQSKQIVTSGIQELTVNVVYRYFKKSAKKAAKKALNLNKTSFTLGILAENPDNIIIHQANGVMNQNMTNATSIDLLPVNHSKLHILIRPQDASDCMMVYAVQITYKFCSKNSFLQIAEFPKTFAPRNASAPLKVEGKCSHNNKKPVGYCNSTGEWSFNKTSMPCSCKSGEIMSRIGCFGKWKAQLLKTQL